MTGKTQSLPMGLMSPTAYLSMFALAAASLLLPTSFARAEDGVDLTRGAVFAMSNARSGNEVVAYSRNADGSIDEVGRYDTRGTGSGSFEDTANGLVLATRAGEIAPNNLVEPNDRDQQFLLVINAGSNNISVFAVHSSGLELVEVQHSAGEKPVSITISSNGLVYVLNSGETDDRLFDDARNVIDNCTTGEIPRLVGFELDAHGRLSHIRGSSRRLSGESISGCSQVSFDASGKVVVVTERLAQPRQLNQQTSPIERLDDEGVINTFVARPNRRLSRMHLLDATGQGPFGFTFTRNGVLLTTEQFDGPAGLMRGGASSYVLDADNRSRSLLASSPSVQNFGTDTCWFVVTDDQMLGFTTSFFADGRISSYAIDELGITRLIQAVATGPDAMDDDVAMGASDMALSRDSAYLYQLNSINGTVSAFRNNGDGTLTLIEMETPFPQPMFGPGGGEAAPVGLAGS